MNLMIPNVATVDSDTQESSDAMKTKVVRLTVDIESDEIITSSEELTQEDIEYSNFEEDIQVNLELRGFILEEEHESDRSGSCSKYFTFSKVEDDLKLKLVIVLRISDHKGRSKQISKGVWKSEKQLRAHYAKKKAEALMKDKYQQSNFPEVRSLDIVFDNTHYTSYTKALRAVLDKVKEIDE